MRVPVLPDDLISNRGFKSMAKQLRKLLHGPSRISLAFAQDLLAKGFGYQHYHDLEQTAKAAPSTGPTVEHSTAKRMIFSNIQAALLLNDVFISEQELQGFVGSLALDSLIAFKNQHASSTSAVRDLTILDIAAVEQVVSTLGSLRDKALFACMQAGVRPVEYRSAMYLSHVGVYRKTKPISEKTALPDSCQYAIKKYAQAAKLSQGDLLFPSVKDSRLPISPLTLNKLLSNWAQSAAIEKKIVTAHGIRTAIKAHEAGLLPDR